MKIDQCLDEQVARKNRPIFGFQNRQVAVKINEFLNGQVAHENRPIFKFQNG